ncbi:MAG: outer membrane protein assembly factor BamA [Verrucomicrobiota bacterium]
MKHLPRSFCRWALYFFVALILVELGNTVSFAQTGIIIRSIDVQYSGPPTVSRERILSQMRTKVGQPYSDTTVEQDIRSLYTAGDVQNVRIFGQPQGDGVKVIVVVQTRTVVREIEIAGSTRFKPKTIRKAIGIKLNASLSGNALEEGRQKIIDLYQGRGFTDIDVQYRTDTDEARGTSRIVYTINEGEKGSVSVVRFEGNKSFSAWVLRKKMKTKGRTLISFLDKSGRLDQTQLQQDLDSLREWYQDHGYIDVVVGEVRKDRTRGRLQLVIPIVEGTKYHVGKITITGNKVATAEKIRLLLKMKEGSVYSPKALREDAKTVADGYGSGGYVDLDIAPQASPAGPGRVDVTYTISEGDRAFVQRINVIGNTRTKDKVVRREVLIVPGDVYNTVRVETSKKRLENLGYFAKVETYPDDTNVPGRKDLTVQVEEKRTGSLNFGAGFSTIDSVVGFVELTQGNFDLLNWPSFTGGGQKFRTRVQFGSQRKDFTLALIEPYFLDRQLSLGGELFYHDASFLSTVYDQRNYGISLTVRKPLNPFTSISVSYRLETLEIYNVPSSASPFIRSQQGSRVKSEITPSLVYDTRDNPFISRTGHRIVFTPYVAGGFLGGDEQIYGFDLEGSQYFKLWYDTILLFNAEMATVETWGSGDQVPIYDRLFLGGGNDLRGFDFREVGPKDGNDVPIGGQSLARLTIEYTIPIIEKVRAAIFYDTGFVNPDPYDFGISHLASDVGIGLRLNLPIGPLRIDYGIPIIKDNNKGSGRFNFNVGYQF